MKRQGFTLIELLIVVAIIGILAAIAIPNFLQAQVRAKVARVRSELRTAAVGLEQYIVDQNDYPPYAGAYPMIWFYLTTPIDYLTSIEGLYDPFNRNVIVDTPSGPNPSQFYMYGYVGWNTINWGNIVGTQRIGLKGYALISVGPDHYADYGELSGIPDWLYEYYDDRTKLDRYYDPTNGTVSRGDILRFGGTHYAPIESS